jgi:Putative  PD-(D/E)XK family member, (DUF4420)
VKLSRLLQPLVDDLGKQPTPGPGTLIGKAIRLMQQGDPPYIALDAEGHVHLLLTPCAEHEDQLVRFRRRSLMIANRPWVVSGRPASEFLDLTLLAPATSPLRRPFLSFCEDILADLEQGELPEDAVRRTCLRWQRFWEEDDSETPSLPWLLGLLGELSVLKTLVDAGGSSAVAAWVGPDAAEHDFQAGTAAALEVKTTLTLPPVITCGLAQLDPGPIGILALAVIHARRQDDAATSLPTLIAEIEACLSGDEEALDDLLAKLARAGYRRHLGASYAAYCFALASPVYYLVNETFPRMTHASFKEPLDARVHRVSYQVELTGLSPLEADDPRMTRVVRALTANS